MTVALASMAVKTTAPLSRFTPAVLDVVIEDWVVPLLTLCVLVTWAPMVPRPARVTSAVLLLLLTLDAVVQNGWLAVRPRLITSPSLPTSRRRTRHTHEPRPRQP